MNQRNQNYGGLYKFHISFIVFQCLKNRNIKISVVNRLFPLLKVNLTNSKRCQQQEWPKLKSFNNFLQQDNSSLLPSSCPSEEKEFVVEGLSSSWATAFCTLTSFSCSLNFLPLGRGGKDDSSGSRSLMGVLTLT